MNFNSTANFDNLENNNLLFESEIDFSNLLQFPKPDFNDSGLVFPDFSSSTHQDFQQPWINFPIANYGVSSDNWGLQENKENIIPENKHFGNSASNSEFETSVVESKKRILGEVTEEESEEETKPVIKRSKVIVNPIILDSTEENKKPLEPKSYNDSGFVASSPEEFLNQARPSPVSSFAGSPNEPIPEENAYVFNFQQDHTLQAESYKHYNFGIPNEQNLNQEEQSHFSVPLDTNFSNIQEGTTAEQQRNEIAQTPESSQENIVEEVKEDATEPKGDAAKRPPDSYVSMIARALLSAENNELPISGIYKWIENKFEFYRSAKDGWKNSVRHALSLHDGFCKFTKKSYSRGHFWTLNPMYKARFEAGDYRKMKKQNLLKYHIQPRCNAQQTQQLQTQHALANITHSQNVHTNQYTLPGNHPQGITTGMMNNFVYPSATQMQNFYQSPAQNQFQSNTISYYSNMYPGAQMNNYLMPQNTVNPNVTFPNGAPGFPANPAFFGMGGNSDGVTGNGMIWNNSFTY